MLNISQNYQNNNSLKKRKTGVQPFFYDHVPSPGWNAHETQY